MIKLWLLALVAGLFSPALAAEEVSGAADGARDQAVSAAADQPAPVSDTDQPGASEANPADAPELIRIEPGVSGIDIENAWVRAMPPFQPNSAGYLTVVNGRETAIGIVGASSSVANKTELHTTRKVDGLMRMEKLDGLAVAPGERSELKPGGNHLMLIGLAFRPVPGDDITLCLELATREEICTSADVRKDGKASSHNHH